MVSYQRIRRQQLLREAEGYLDLVWSMADRWPLPPEVRDPVAQRALDALEILEKTSSPRAQVLFLRGQALRLMERYEEALIPLQQAADLDPGDTHIQLALGWCYKRCDQIEQAIEALEDALACEPDDAILHYNLACYWSLAGNADLAVEYLSQAFQLDPSYRALVAAEHDFDPIRQDPRFLAATSVIV